MKKIKYNSPVVLTFALISFLVLILGILTGGASTLMCFTVYRSSATNPLTYIRLFGHVLGHSGFTHFFGNMTLFLVVGPPLEEKMGSRDLLFAIAVTALASGLVHLLVGGNTALLGASGVVFMMIVLSSITGSSRGEIPLTLILVCIIYLGGEIWEGLTTDDTVSQLAHITGGLCGIGLGLFASHGKK